ncbi:MAG: hypothetical protein M3R23_01670, partial [Actinomycetota bacterium]|nr:hypothetical protein [Actinomycetota bacterium]
MPINRHRPLVLATALATVALAAAAIAHAVGPSNARLGPYPGLGDCGVFPQPSVAAGAPSATDESAWNQDISNAPVDPNSAAYIDYINSHGGDMLHPDFGSPRAYG